MAGGAGIHRSASFQGAQLLSNAGNAKFQGPSGTNAFTAFWVKLDTIVAATYYSFFDIGPVGTEVLGMRLDGPTGHVVSFAYNDVNTFTQIDSLVSLTAGLWYHLQTNWGATIANTIYDHNGVSLGGQSGAFDGGDTTYRPTAAPALYLGERSDNTFPVIGEIDSFAHWRSGNVGATGIPASLVNGGKALEYSQLANGANPIPVWYDFNEATGASTWKDSSSNGVSLTATGTILSKPGAGF